MAKKEFTLSEARTIAAKLGIDFNLVDFSPDDFVTGLNVELEHGTRDSETNVTNDDPITTGKIAWAHLKEFGDYYVRLDQMEKEAEGKL
jgi:hypothetical protein